MKDEKVKDKDCDVDGSNQGAEEDSQMSYNNFLNDFTYAAQCSLLPQDSIKTRKK